MTPNDPPLDKKIQKKMKKAFASGHAGVSETPLFQPRELDIYVNRVTHEAYIFHGIDIDYDSIVSLEYSASDYKVDVLRKDGTRQDLGVKIQWLVRPYFSKAEQVNLMQTKDGEPVKSVAVKLVHKTKK